MAKKLSVTLDINAQITNMGDQISKLKKQLDSLDPGSKLYKNLSASLTKVQNDFALLSRQSKKAFTSQGQISQFENNITKLGEKILLIGDAFGQISFNNLNLTQKDLAPIRELSQSIADIRNEINKIETNEIENLVSSSKELKTIFDELQIDPKNLNFDDALKQLNDYEKRTKSTLQKRTNRKDSLLASQNYNEQLLRDSSIFNKKFLSNTSFFSSRGFKSGKKQEVRQLLESLSIDETLISKATKDGAAFRTYYDEVLKAVQDARIKITNEQTKLKADIEKQNSLIEDSASKIKNVAVGKETIETGKQDTTLLTKIEEQNKKIQELKEKIKQYEQGLIKASGAQTTAAQTSQVLSESLEQIGDGATAASSELKKLQDQQQKLENIQYGIKQWLGFTEVVNLTKNAIREAISHIRDLDKVMTEIAVVTDMTQEDLWGQIGTYSALAKEYGVATTGVYEVSMLFYQQGWHKIKKKFM